MKLYPLIISVSLIVAGCGGHARKDDSMAAAGPTGPAVTAVTIQKSIPYAQNNAIADNIKSECDLNNKLSNFIQSASATHSINVTQKDEIAKEDQGQVLIVEIVDAISSGNAFIGHNKFTKIKGELYTDGALTGSFIGTRHSGGGAFGGWKGSCAVLGRTVKALGSDVAKFLTAPGMNARLGES